MNKNFTRKEFLKFAGLGAAAISLPGFASFGRAALKPSIGIQLYTIRKEIEKDFEGSIKKIADMGYKGIETYFLPESIELERAAKVFKQNNIEIFSMHAELPVDKNMDAALRMADAYKCDKVVYHGWPRDEKYKSAEALKKTVDLYNNVADSLESRGLKFGLHDHWWEFEKNDDGIYPFYYLLDNLDKKIFFELDTYWVKTAGVDPASAVKKFGRRAPFLHIKDGPAVKGDLQYKQVPLGEGSQDFQKIINAGGDNIKWMIVEFDEYDGNIFDAVRKSYNYLAGNIKY